MTNKTYEELEKENEELEELLNRNRLLLSELYTVAEEQEKRIEELKKENKQLKQNIEKYFDNL